MTMCAWASVRDVLGPFRSKSERPAQPVQPAIEGQTPTGTGPDAVKSAAWWRRRGGWLVYLPRLEPLFPGIIRRAGASLLDRTVETTPTRRARNSVRLTPETIIMVYPSERTYLRQLRILGAWWCLGSSPLAPRVLLLYPPAPLGIFGRL